MDVDWFGMLVIILPAIIPMVFPSILSIIPIVIIAIGYAMREAILQRITKWILESKASDKYIELVSEEALGKLLRIIVERYRISVRFFGAPWQRKLFKEICDVYHGHELTKKDEEFVWRGKVDNYNWTDKDLLECGGYHKDTIKRFRDCVEKIKEHIKNNLCLGEIYPEMFLINVSETACKLTVLNDDLSPESALIEIRRYAKDNLFKRSADLLGGYNRTISYDDEYARELRKNTLKITDAYNQVMFRIAELKTGIDLLNDNISKYECLGDDEYAGRVQRIEKQRGDLISIQPELDTICGLLAELTLPKDESPANT